MEITKMKIKNVDGTISDTDKMDDFKAELVEKSNEINSFFRERGVAYYLRYNNHNRKECGGSINFDDVNKTSPVLTQMRRDLEEFTGLTFIAVENDDDNE